jgi:nucleoside-diphosphate-sugar epimerase
VSPRQLYGISKFTSELIADRYRELFGLPAVSIRLSSVYGPMDRATSARNYRHIPHQIAHLALEGVSCVRVNSLDGVGDYINAEDVARAIAALLRAPELRYRTYNVAAGATATLGDFVTWAAEEIPGFRAKAVPALEAEVSRTTRSGTAHGRVRHLADPRRYGLEAPTGPRGIS